MSDTTWNDERRSFNDRMRDLEIEMAELRTVAAAINERADRSERSIEDRFRRFEAAQETRFDRFEKSQNAIADRLTAAQVVLADKLTAMIDARMTEKLGTFQKLSKSETETAISQAVDKYREAETTKSDKRTGFWNPYIVACFTIAATILGNWLVHH